MIIAIECRWRRRHTKNILENWMRRSNMLTLSIRRCVVVIVLVYDQISLFFFFSFLFWFFFFCNSEIISRKGLGNSYVFFWLFLSSYKTAPNYSGRDGGKVSYSGLCLLYSFDYLPLRAKVFLCDSIDMKMMLLQEASASNRVWWSVAASVWPPTAIRI